MNVFSWQEFHGGDQKSVDFYLFLQKTVSYFDEIPFLNMNRNEALIVFDSRSVDVILTKDSLFIDGEEKIAMVKKTFKA